MDTFAKRLKELREQHHLSMMQLANVIHVSDAAISNWENSINEPKISYLVALSKYFEVSTDYLLGLEDEDGHKEPVDYDFEYSHADTKLIHREKGK